ncbi:hypothetical protein PTTG_02644 [Puccinia triticina 1-1 BBBD Race 1]|uniref:DUF7918 domain-containing protein n=2 Tax=Puccinia triticina TaxID=208348 RepID=A0A0C4EPE3_PUCT1|nr:uncharacterized protein PtA15_1A121 [Puccinia triticina]OAV91885.1 hypothetical protein PTTG_02644 [Puccinia triticina 1-1 BBBD Race 1]WAQ80783.1 hypothetical protein PtA15_1A121 [Puccinia triticina]WAR51676.1 hypothetical protein PtB15_1B112 [Puccinia triticina]
MPANAASGSSCTINLLQPSPLGPPTKVPCHEYKHETSIDPTNGAIQETVTIESEQASRFEIVLDLKPTTYSSIRGPPNQPDLTTTNESQLQLPFDYIVNLILDGIHVGVYKQTKYAWNLPVYLDKLFSRDCSTVQSYQFANINLVDPDDYRDSTNPADRICEDERVIKSLGTIQLDITRCVFDYRPIPPTNNGVLPSSTNQMKFSERSKKARLSTTAGLTESSSSGLPTPAGELYAKALDPAPFLRFLFQYKPRVILETEGTITRPAVEVDADPAKEVRPKVKNENNKRVKTEGGNEKAPKKKPKIIDLTSSGDESS